MIKEIEARLSKVSESRLPKPVKFCEREIRRRSLFGKQLLAAEANSPVAAIFPDGALFIFGFSEKAAVSL